MLRTRLPWLFMALAVASPPLWFWYVSWSVRDDYDGTGYAIGVFIFWPIVSLTCISLFVTLAALTWRPAPEGRDFRRLVLFVFGGPSLLIGLVIFIFTVANAPNLTALATAGGTGLVLLGVGFLTMVELLRPTSTATRGSD